MMPPEPPLYEPPPPPLFEVAEKSCVYVRVDGGYGISETPHIAHSMSFNANEDESWFVEGGLGCRVTPYLRADVTIGYRDGMHLEDKGNTLDANFSAVTGMVNAYWDIAHVNGITPYVGAGIGLTANILSGIGRPMFQSGNTTYDFAYALMAGVSYDVSERVTVDAGYRFVDLGSAEASGGNSIRYESAKFHDFRIGLRYNFE